MGSHSSPPELAPAPKLSAGEIRKAKEKTHKCKFCDAAYCEARSLRVHNDSHHKENRPEFPCDGCNKVLHTLAGLIFHKKMAKDAGIPCNVPLVFYCNICERDIKNTIARHERTSKMHKKRLLAPCTGSHLFHCNICKKDIRNTIARHERTSKKHKKKLLALRESDSESGDDDDSADDL